MSAILGERPKFQRAAAAFNPRGESNAGGNSLLAAELNAKYGGGAQNYNYIGAKAPIIGDGVMPFREDLRMVYNVNMPFQVGQHSFDKTLKASTTSLLSIAGTKPPSGPSSTGSQ